MSPLHYEPMGQGPDLVLIHGFAMNSIFLKPLAEQLAHHYRVHLFDLPGFGTAFQTPLQDHPKALAEYLLKYLPPKAIWIGWSLGGLIASWIAIHHPKHVHTLINIATSPYFLADLNWPGISQEAFITFSQNLKQDYAKTLIRFLNLQLANTDSSKKWLQKLKQIIKHQPYPSHETLDAAIKIIANTNLREKIHKIQIPCLYLFGEKDRLVSAGIAKKLASKNIKTHILPEAAHLPFLSHPEDFLSTLKLFLGTHVSSMLAGKR